MQVKSVEISNFRGYKDRTKIEIDDLTVLVGQNDIGKTTILEALDIFFNDGKGNTKIDKNDVNIENKKCGMLTTSISVTFAGMPDKILIDSSVETTLADEYMLNKDGYLQIVKKYEDGGTPKIYIRAMHPSNEKCCDLLLRTNAKLKTIVKENDIRCENLSINSELRKSIWKYYKDELNLIEQDIELNKEDAKKIWEKLSIYLPIYTLFKSDRTNSDGDSEVQDPLREAAKEIISDPEIQEELSKIAKKVKNRLDEVANNTLEKIKEMNPQIAHTLSPVIPPVESLKWADVFKNVSITGDDGIAINKRGSGVRRLILLNFFRAQAEERTLNGNSNVIYAIEEPETAQHPNNQRMLIDALKNLSNRENTQVIMTTHSAYIVKKLKYSNLRLIVDMGDNKKVMMINEGQLDYPSLNEVNYLAFGEASEEYHDELYGYIKGNRYLSEYVKKKKTIPYIKEYIDNKTKEVKSKKVYVVLTQYIRDVLHHPENTKNKRYTIEDLEKSIEMMRDFLKSKR